MFTFGTFIPSTFLPPARPLTVYSADIYFEYIRIINNSPYQLYVGITGVYRTIPEFWVQDIPVLGYFQGQISVTPSINISTVSHAQSNSLVIEGYNLNELDAPISQAIPQQAVTATASGKPLYTATIGFGATAAIKQILNVFNPPGSNVSFTFHAARAFTNDATVPTCNLAFVPGADINLGTAVPAVSHAGQSTPPISFAHATASDQAGGVIGTNPIIEVLNMQASTVEDMLAFPDNTTLAPGGNLVLELSAGAAGHIVRLTFKWSEDIFVPPQGGQPTFLISPHALYDGDLTIGGLNTLTANTAYFVGVTLYATVFLSAIRARFGTGGTGHFDVGVYTDSAGSPGTLVDHAALTATSLVDPVSATVNPAFLNGNMQLQPGRYWLAFWIDNAVDQVLRQAAASGFAGPVKTLATAGPLPASGAGAINASTKIIMAGLIVGNWS